MKDAKVRYSLIAGLLVLVSYLLFFLSCLAFGLVQHNRSAIDGWREDGIVLSKEADGNLSLSRLSISEKDMRKQRKWLVWFM